MFHFLVAAFLVVLAPQSPSAEPTLKELRNKVVKADAPEAKAKAYQEYFEKIGRKGLGGLLKDDDTGIALQAAWEIHTKAIKRPKRILHRSNDVYDPAELAKFLAFVKKRTKAPVPDWWATRIVDIDLFPGQHHAVLGEAGPELPEGTELKPDGKFQVYSRGGKSVRFLTNTFDDEGDLFGGGIAGLITGKGSAIADYFPIGGASFRLAGFEGKGGKARWKTTVWAACRQSGNGFGRHSVELTSKDNTLFVFGAETHGIYLEAFDMATGKCQFRFCSCYWFTFSETWARKD